MAAAGMLVFGSINEYYEFFFTADLSYEIIDYLLTAAILTLLFYGHLSMMLTSSFRKRMIPSALAGCGIVVVLGLFVFAAKSDFSNELNYPYKMKPVGHRMVRTETPEQFLGGLESLRKDVDAMVEKEKPKRKKLQQGNTAER